jgi:O-antigen ligase
MEAVLVIAGIVAIVWGAVVFLRGGLIGGCLAVLLAGCCFGHAWFHVSMAPIPLTLDRVLWCLLLVQYVVWRRLGWADPKPLTKAEIVLLTFFAALLVSTLSHDWRIANNRPLSQFVFMWLMPLGLYWVARQMPLGERAILVWFGCLTALGLYLAVTAIAETQQLWWLVYPSYIGSAEFPEFLGRGRGPLLNPAGSGMFQGICLGALLLWWPRAGRAGRLAIVAGSLLLAVGIYCTLTRSVWIGAALGLCIVLGLTLPRQWRIPLVAGALLVASLVAVTQWERIVAFKRDQALDADAAAESVELRPLLAVVAWKMFLDRPLLGCGFGQYQEVSGDYTSDRTSQLVLEKARTYIQHNVVLSLLTETGLVGAGLFVTLLAMWTHGAWGLWQSPTAPLWIRQQGLLFLALMGNYGANAMFHDVSLIAMVNMLLFFSAGVTMALGNLGATGAQQPVSSLNRV